jgi:hypothetical protein
VAKAEGRSLAMDLRPAIESLGLNRVLEQIENAVQS